MECKMCTVHPSYNASDSLIVNSITIANTIIT